MNDDCELCYGKGWYMKVKNPNAPVLQYRRTPCDCERNEPMPATKKKTAKKKTPAKKGAAKKKPAAKKKAPAKKTAQLKNTRQRTYRHVDYTATKNADGTCTVNGKPYRSLTAAALEITGYKTISGPAFFGFTK